MNEQVIWQFLKSKGANDYGAAGLMGNLFAESALNPKNLQNSFEKKFGMTDESYTTAVDNGSYTNFIHDSAGFGLAQWTYWSRKQNLLNYARSVRKSIGDLGMQLDFLYQELSTGYPAIWKTICSAPSVMAASNAVLLNYERPADQSEAVQSKRASYGQGYYDQFAHGTTQGGKEMSNSPLVSYTQLSPNHSGKRTHSIDTITIHCFVGQVNAKRGCEVFMPKSKQASCNYVVGCDGSIGLCVEEKNKSWCSSSNSNDQRAITIEVASDSKHPYAVRDAAYSALLELVTDICRRNGKKKLLWFGDKAKTLAYTPAADEMVMTVHRWFANKACPGEWLYSRHGQIAAEVNARLGQETEDEDMTLDKFKELMKEYRAELQDNDCGTWSKDAREWAIANGLINGTGATINGEPNYAWADNLSREQAAALFYRFAKLMGKA